MIGRRSLQSFNKERGNEMTKKISTNVAITSVLIGIVGILFGGAMTFYTSALNSQIAYWKDRSEILKANIDRMKTEADKLADICSQTKPQDQSVKIIKTKIDNNYRNSLLKAVRKNHATAE